ncbi:HNH endonuclease [Mesorhizobium sp. ASY16-5R]|uniref:HNH endonuclease n=1 Tax=Mesorhizobium sp. ASY16-5R TaxID=3445772 RepID=UPI003F9FF0A5
MPGQFSVKINRCRICGARIDKKSMHLDHVVEKSSGGLADIENSQWLHPYCDSTAKYQVIPPEREEGLQPQSLR